MTEFTAEKNENVPFQKSHNLKLSQTTDQDGRIEQFLTFYSETENLMSKMRSKITDSLTKNDYIGLKKVFFDLKNFEEIDLLIFTSIELSELEDEELTRKTRNMVVQLEDQKDSLILQVTTILSYINGSNASIDQPEFQQHTPICWDQACQNDNNCTVGANLMNDLLNNGQDDLTLISDNNQNWQKSCQKGINLTLINEQNDKIECTYEKTRQNNDLTLINLQNDGIKNSVENVSQNDMTLTNEQNDLIKDITDNACQNDLNLIVEQNGVIKDTTDKSLENDLTAISDPNDVITRSIEYFNLTKSEFENIQGDSPESPNHCEMSEGDMNDMSEDECAGKGCLWIDGVTEWSLFGQREERLSTISESAEEYEDEEEIRDRKTSNDLQNWGQKWPSVQLRDHIQRILSEIKEAPFEQILQIFEANYKEHPDFRVVDDLIEDFMKVSISCVAAEVIKHVEMSKDFIYIQKSRILRLILILCAINCKFHGLDLNHLDRAGLSEIIELMHYELCLSTSLLTMFQHVVRVEETQLIDEQSGLVEQATCSSALESLNEMYLREPSVLEQSMSILLLQRLYHYISKRANAPDWSVTGQEPVSAIISESSAQVASFRLVSRGQTHVVELLALTLCACLLLYLLLFDTTYLRLQTFGERPQ